MDVGAFIIITLKLSSQGLQTERGVGRIACCLWTNAIQSLDGKPASFNILVYVTLCHISPCSDLWELRTSTMQNTQVKLKRLMPTPLPRIWWLQAGRIGHLQSVIADSRHWDLDSSSSIYDSYKFMEDWGVMSNVTQSRLSWETFCHGISYLDFVWAFVRPVNLSHFRQSTGHRRHGVINKLWPHDLNSTIYNYWFGGWVKEPPQNLWLRFVK